MLQTIVDVTGLSMQDLLVSYEQLFYSQWVQSDPAFKSDEARHMYCAMKTHGDNISRPKQAVHKLIPIGVDSIRISRKSRAKRNSLFVLEQTSKGYMHRRVNCPDQTASIYTRVPFFMLSDVLAGKFSSGEDLILDDRSHFDNSVQTGLSQEQLMEASAKQFGWKRIKINEAVNQASRAIASSAPASGTRASSTRSFIDSLDWRIVRGLIVDMNNGKRDDGTEWGLYKISDETVTGGPMVMPDGRMIYPGLSVWVNPWLMRWAKGSMCDFFGTIALDRDTDGKVREPHTAAMTAFQILPIFGQELPEVES